MVELRRCPEGQLLSRARSMSPSLPATTQWDLGFHNVRGVIDPGDLRFRFQVVEVLDIWKDF